MAGNGMSWGRPPGTGPAGGSGSAGGAERGGCLCVTWLCVCCHGAALCCLHTPRSQPPWAGGEAQAHPGRALSCSPAGCWGSADMWTRGEGAA